MNERVIIDTVVERLAKYPAINFKRKNGFELEIFAADESGFDILLQTNEREHILHLGNFHWHYENNEDDVNEMLNLLVLALAGIARVKEASKNGRAYKWTLQIQDDSGHWYDHGFLSLFNFNFWTKPKVKYLQNHLLHMMTSPPLGSGQTTIAKHPNQ